MDEIGSSGSAEFEDFDDDEVWRAEDGGIGKLPPRCFDSGKAAAQTAVPLISK